MNFSLNCSEIYAAFIFTCSILGRLQSTCGKRHQVEYTEVQVLGRCVLMRTVAHRCGHVLSTVLMGAKIRTDVTIVNLSMFSHAIHSSLPTSASRFRQRGIHQLRRSRTVEKKSLTAALLTSVCLFISFPRSKNAAMTVFGY